MALPLPAGSGFVLGSDPYDDRITCLADLRDPGSLPKARFELCAVVDIRPTRGLAVADTIVNALKPGGVLLCGSTLPAAKELRSRGLDVTGHGVWPWRVLECRAGSRSR